MIGGFIPPPDHPTVAGLFVLAERFDFRRQRLDDLPEEAAQKIRWTNAHAFFGQDFPSK